MIDESLSWKYHISLSVPFISKNWNDIEIKPGISYPSVQRIKQIHYNLSSIIFLIILITLIITDKSSVRTNVHNVGKQSISFMATDKKEKKKQVRAYSEETHTLSTVKTANEVIFLHADRSRNMCK